jgi:hypothetical protein
MERARKRLNRGIRTYYYNSNAKVITHADLQDGHKALYAYFNTCTNSKNYIAIQN